MSALILVERLLGGFYRASRGACVLTWDPATEPPTRALTPTTTKAFLRDLRDLDLGAACTSCGYLYYEHHIDGEERAPCNDFAATPPPGDAPLTEGGRKP